MHGNQVVAKPIEGLCMASRKNTISSYPLVFWWLSSPDGFTRNKERLQKSWMKEMYQTDHAPPWLAFCGLRVVEYTHGISRLSYDETKGNQTWTWTKIKNIKLF